MEALPQAAAIWMIMLLVVAVTTAVIALPRKAAAGPALLLQPVDEPDDDDLRYAAEVATAADREARRAAAATAYPVMRRRRARDENAQRERFLHRTAIAACRNREISIAQLNDALAHRGWNARLHPAAQESALRGAVREFRFATYQRAAERERQAWETAEEAAELLRSLRAEAFTGR